MRASDSSVGNAADQFHTTPWAVMISAGSPSQSVSLALCDALAAAEVGPSPISRSKGHGLNNHFALQLLFR
jgi:hypothetical protein